MQSVKLPCQPFCKKGVLDSDKDHSENEINNVCVCHCEHYSHSELIKKSKLELSIDILMMRQKTIREHISNLKIVEQQISEDLLELEKRQQKGDEIDEGIGRDY